MKNLSFTIPYHLLPIPLCILLLLACAGLRPKKEVRKINPHREQKYCLQCHIKEGSRKLRASTTKLCIRCHQKIIKDGCHPVNVVYSKQVAGLLYFEKKRIVCITCHEPHGKMKYGKLLRMNPNDLCLACHPK